jgi:hypothetical protein
VDLSGLIFVALAVAWAAYLIPKALRHHDDVVRGRSVDRFSQRMRVLAHREPISARMARLVETPARATADPSPVTPHRPEHGPEAEPEQPYAARRAAAGVATRRRRRVLSVLLLGLVAVVALCASGRLAWSYAAIPGGLLVAWLVACRLMVRRERAWRPVTATDAEAVDPGDPDTMTTGTHEPVRESAAPADPDVWDPVPVTLPTYVSKPAARRTVRTIDLDSTGVWTSGRTEADSALAREAEAADRVRRRVSRKGEAGEEAVGS